MHHNVSISIFQLSDDFRQFIFCIFYYFVLGLRDIFFYYGQCFSRATIPILFPTS